jgi:hypothetical protein
VQVVSGQAGRVVPKWSPATGVAFVAKRGRHAHATRSRSRLVQNSVIGLAPIRGPSARGRQGLEWPPVSVLVTWSTGSRGL